VTPQQRDTILDDLLQSGRLQFSERYAIGQLRAENKRLSELNAALKGERGVFASMAAKRDRLIEPMSVEKTRERADAILGRRARLDD
jgi:hypothetical protein